MPNLRLKSKYHFLGNTIKIVITGPESSGKTTLAQALAGHLGVKHVPEFARTYLEFLGRPYVPEDLPAIFQGQMAWEDFYLAKNQPFLICDTDWTVIQVWEMVIRPDQHLQVPQRPWDLALLCRPDIPWEDDPLREHPNDRDMLFAKYLKLLESTGWPFKILSGDHDQRMTAALAAIRKLS